MGFEREVEHFLDQVMAVSAATADVFGGVFPFAEYTYVYATDPRELGPGERSLHLVGIGDGVFIDDEERRAAIRLVAHELFHAWNVCRLRPRAPCSRTSFGSFPTGFGSARASRGTTSSSSPRASARFRRRDALEPRSHDRALRALPATRHTTLVDPSLATFLNHNRYRARPARPSGLLRQGHGRGVRHRRLPPHGRATQLARRRLPRVLRGVSRARLRHERRDRLFDEYAAPLGPIEPLGALLERCAGAEMPDIVAWLARLGVTSARAEVPHPGCGSRAIAGRPSSTWSKARPRQRLVLGPVTRSSDRPATRSAPDALACLFCHEASFDVEIQSGTYAASATVRPSPHSIVSELSLPDGAPGSSVARAGAADPRGAHAARHYDNFHARESMQSQTESGPPKTIRHRQLLQGQSVSCSGARTSAAPRSTFTVEKHLDKAWLREALADVSRYPPSTSLRDVVLTVSYLARTHRFDRGRARRLLTSRRQRISVSTCVCPEWATAKRLFRDKLADAHLGARGGDSRAEFTAVFNDDEVRAFAARVPAPWMLRRASASATGIKKITSETALWDTLHALGDERASLPRALPAWRRLPRRLDRGRRHGALPRCIGAARRPSTWLTVAASSRAAPSSAGALRIASFAR